MSYLKKGETYKVDVAALIAADTEHSHGLVNGKQRDVHTVTVTHVNAHHQCYAECECGFKWVFADTGGISDARYRINPRARSREHLAVKATTTKTATRKRGGYGRRAR